jgi:hypothetical protein
MGLKLQVVPARQGLRWVSQGLGECRRHPLGYASLFIGFMFLAVALSLLPLFGGLLLMMGIPLLSLAYMMATLGSLRGNAPRLGVYIAPWVQPGPQRRKLLLLCLAYTLATTASMALCDLIDGGAVDKLVLAMGAGGSEADSQEFQRLASQPGVLPALFARIGLTALLGVPFWHAPALVLWGQQGPAQALFSSTLAIWRSRGAFLFYGFGWMVVFAICAGLMSIVLALFGGGAWANLVALPIGLFLTTAYYVSLFFTFKDSFGLPDSE